MEHVSDYLPGILLAYSAFLLGIASPGPNVLAVIGTSMSAGRPSGIALALGVATGSLTWAVLTVLGLSALLAAYSSALTVIKLAGGCYLIWLAYKSFKAAANSNDIETRTIEGSGRSPFSFLLRGYIVQMTNPKAALTWIAIISLGLQKGAPLWVAVAIVLGTFALSVLAHVLYAVAFSTPFMVSVYSHARRKIQIVLGGFFAFAGSKLLMSSN